MPDLATCARAPEVADGFCLWVDAGVQDPESDADQGGLCGGRARVVPGPGGRWLVRRRLRAAVAALSGDRAVFSLDLRAGRPLTSADWGSTDAWDLACQAIASGVRRLLVLDLARVGEGTRNGHPGGTVRAIDRRLADGRDRCRRRASGTPATWPDCGSQGVAAALVASALHDGRLTPGKI